MQKLANIIVIQSLPLATRPAHAVFPACRTLTSIIQVHQASPHPPKNLEGFSVSMAKSPLHKPCITEGNMQQFFVIFITDIQYAEGNKSHLTHIITSKIKDLTFIFWEAWYLHISLIGELGKEVKSGKIPMKISGSVKHTGE